MTSGGVTSSISGFRNALLSAGVGNAVLDASQFSGSSLLIGGTGDDTLIGSHGNDTLVAGAGSDSLVGGGGNDTFSFVAPPSDQTQTNGDDVFAYVGSSGSMTIDEPEGTNVATLDFSQAPAGVAIDLSQTGPQTVILASDGFAGLTLTLSDPMGISNVIGSTYDDTIIGNNRDNTLIGNGGEDLIAGLGGNDMLQGDVTRTVVLDFETLTVPGEHVYTTAERNAIQAQLTADYSAFSYDFTQTPPAVGPYTTIYFNDPVLTGLEGPRLVNRLAGRVRLRIVLADLQPVGGLPDDPDRRRPAISTATPVRLGRSRSSRMTRPTSTSTTSSAARTSRRPRAPTSSACRRRSPRTSWATCRASSMRTRSGRSATASTRT